MIFLITTFLKILSIIVLLLICVAYFTIAERKIMGSMQRRKGPNAIGFLGLLQPFSDGLKLFTKEITFPISANTSIFLFSPTLSFILSLILRRSQINSIIYVLHSVYINDFVSALIMLLLLHVNLYTKKISNEIFFEGCVKKRNIQYMGKEFSLLSLDLVVFLSLT